MPKLQRSSATKKVSRSSTAHKCNRVDAATGCCCGCACNATCIKVVVAGSWIDAAHTIANPFVGTWYVPFTSKPLAIGGVCVFGFFCDTDLTVDGTHYTGAVFSLQYGQVGGYNAIQAFHAWLINDSGGTLQLPRIGTFTPQPNSPVLATSSGCASIVTWTPATQGYVGYVPAYAADLVITFEVVSGTSCVDNQCEPTGCLSSCCPDATCVEGTVSVTFTSGTVGDDIGELTLPFTAALADNASASSCFTYTDCITTETIDGVEWTTRWSINPLHHYCNSDGDLIWEFSGSWSRISNDGHAYYAEFFTEDLQTEAGFICGDEITGSLTIIDLTPGATYGQEVGTGTITFAIKETCEDNPACGFSHSCPDTCYTCTEACGERCWTGATITTTYNLATGECGTCLGGLDGCLICCTCPYPDDPGGCISMVSDSIQDCIDVGGCPYCPPACTGDGGGGASPCSRLDYTGSVELVFTGIVGDEIHFEATLDFGDPIIVFDVWFDCTDERWYGSVTVNSICVFTGSLNGACEFFPGLPQLDGVDTDLPGSDCTLSGSLIAADVVFADYTCPEVP